MRKFGSLQKDSDEEKKIAPGRYPQAYEGYQCDN